MFLKFVHGIGTANSDIITAVVKPLIISISGVKINEMIWNIIILVMNIKQVHFKFLTSLYFANVTEDIGLEELSTGKQSLGWTLVRWK